MAGRRNFRIMTSSQQSGIQSKKKRKKYANAPNKNIRGTGVEVLSYVEVQRRPLLNKEKTFWFRKRW